MFPYFIHPHLHFRLAFRMSVRSREEKYIRKELNVISYDKP